MLNFDTTALLPSSEIFRLPTRLNFRRSSSRFLVTWPPKVYVRSVASRFAAQRYKSCIRAQLAGEKPASSWHDPSQEAAIL